MLECSLSMSVISFLCFYCRQSVVRTVFLSIKHGVLVSDAGITGRDLIDLCIEIDHGQTITLSIEQVLRSSRKANDPLIT